jgi:hypothetical protein
LWENATGRPLTDIMREGPWLFTLPAICVLAMTAWKLSGKYWARAVILYLVLGVRFAGGHLFWWAASSPAVPQGM